jgi:hypothetical protein
MLPFIESDWLLLTLSDYTGYMTFKFNQIGANEKSFWSVIGLKTEPEDWDGPGHDYYRNAPNCFFFYRIDQVVFFFFFFSSSKPFQSPLFSRLGRCVLQQAWLAEA